MDLIDRQAAIDAVNDCGICIQRIVDLPSAQPETHEERTETHECDYISRQAAIDEIKQYINHLRHIDKRRIKVFDAMLMDIKAILEQLPTAEPEITACGDCKYYIPHDKRCGYWNHGVKPLDWCCYAERRTE